MSDKNQARRTDVKVAFNGTDISKSLRENLLSMTYTDNSEDASDDLQIQVARALLIATVTEKIQRFEPRAEVRSVTFSYDDSNPGRLIPTVEVEILNE
jgi:phage protein D